MPEERWICVSCQCGKLESRPTADAGCLNCGREIAKEITVCTLTELEQAEKELEKAKELIGEAVGCGDWSFKATLDQIRREAAALRSQQ